MKLFATPVLSPSELEAIRASPSVQQRRHTWVRRDEVYVGWLEVGTQSLLAVKMR